MIACYILYSKTLNRYYVGATQSSIKERIIKHNEKFYGNNKFTATTNDWELFLSIEVLTYTHALRIEKAIKKMKSSVYIKNLEKYASGVNEEILAAAPKI